MAPDRHLEIWIKIEVWATENATNTGGISFLAADIHEAQSCASFQLAVLGTTEIAANGVIAARFASCFACWYTSRVIRVSHASAALGRPSRLRHSAE
jgi:hypothetical protein